MSVKQSAILVTMSLGCGLALAAEDEMPEAAFIEYLGLWAESDEDWLLFEEPITADSEERSDPAPEGEESTENTDES